MNRLFCLIIILQANLAIAQTDLKLIKKEITIKPVKELKPLTGSEDRFYTFISKETNYLWDAKSKKAVLEGFSNVKVSAENGNWIEYEGPLSNGVYQISSDELIFFSASKFKIIPTAVPKVWAIFCDHKFGLFDSQNDQQTVIDGNNPPSSNEIIWQSQQSRVWVNYSTKEKALVYHKEVDVSDDPQFESLSIKNHKGYTVLDLKGPNPKVSFYNSRSGELVKDVMAQVINWEKGFILRDKNDNFSYLNYELKYLFKNIPIDGHQLEHFQKLFDPRISELTYIFDGLYQVKLNDFIGFYNMVKRRFETTLYDEMIAIGPNHYFGGFDYFTKKNGKYGAYNTNLGEVLKPKYGKVEFRATSDGFGFRADNEFRKYKEVIDDELTFSTKWKRQGLVQWSDSLDKISPILYHITENEEYQILSFRNTTADVQDFENDGSWTLYNKGSGVKQIQDGAWRMRPSYHAITPYKDFYIVLELGNSNRTWTQTKLYDEDFYPIGTRRFGISFVYNDQFIVRDEDWHLISYDINYNYILKTIAKVDYVAEDFRLVDGYLFLGHNRYNQDKTPNGFDIIQILTPELELIENKEFGFLEYIGNSLISVGQIPADFKRESIRDMYQKNFQPEAKGVYDLKAKKLISPWYSDIIVGRESVSVVENGKSRSIKIASLRSEFK